MDLEQEQGAVRDPKEIIDNIELVPETLHVPFGEFLHDNLVLAAILVLAGLVVAALVFWRLRRGGRKLEGIEKGLVALIAVGGVLSTALLYGFGGYHKDALGTPEQNEAYAKLVYDTYEYAEATGYYIYPTEWERYLNHQTIRATSLADSWDLEIALDEESGRPWNPGARPLGGMTGGGQVVENG